MPPSDPRIKVTSSADFAELLPFLLGHQPEDCIVVHGIIDTGTGPTMTLSLPDDPAMWEAAAQSFAPHFLHTTRDRGCDDIRDIVVFLCRTPEPGQTPDETVQSLWPLAGWIVHAFSDHGHSPLRSVIALVDDRWWAYDCELPGCCEGVPLRSPDDPSSIAARLAPFGMAPGPSSTEIASEYRPTTTGAVLHAEVIEDVSGDIKERILTRLGQALTREGTAKIIEGALKDFHNGTPQLADYVVARIIVGLQDPKARDRALAHTEDDDLRRARQLWGYLARCCVPPYTHLAPPLLTLLGWTAWHQDDIVTARHAVREALAIDPDYRMANALHAAINGASDRNTFLEIARAANQEQVEEDQAEIDAH